MSDVKNYTDGSRRRPYEVPSISSPEMRHIQHFMIGSLKISLEAFESRSEMGHLQNFLEGGQK